MRFGAARCGLGTAPLGSSPDGPLWWGPQDRRTAIDTVAAAVEAAVAFIDTAPFYGWGRAETIVGAAISAASPDERPPILTKCGTVRRADGRVAEDGSRDAVRADVMASLDRLGVERIDVVQLHDPDPSTPIEITWEALLELRAEGLIDGAGLSNHPVELMERASKVGPIDVVQHQYSLLWRVPETNGVLDWCTEHGIPFLAWAPLASGFLTAELDLDALDPHDLRHGLPWATTASDRTQRTRRALAAIADERMTTMASIALGWLCRHPGVRPIVGARTAGEAAALALPPIILTDLELATIELAADPAPSKPASSGTVVTSAR